MLSPSANSRSTGMSGCASPRLDARTGADGREASRADDGIRTRDPHLGKVMLYQLSHVRKTLPSLPDYCEASSVPFPESPGAARPGRRRLAG